MISDKISVKDTGKACEGISAALDMVEKTAKFCGYEDKEASNLRLLAEEMVAGSAVILDFFDGVLWVQTQDGNFQILLEMSGVFNQVERERLIALTRDNKNTLPKGFFGKVAMILSNALTGESAYPYGAMVDPSGAILWSSRQMVEQAIAMSKASSEEPELEGIEKKILSGMADDVFVSARPDLVVITVVKALPKK